MIFLFNDCIYLSLSYLLTFHVQKVGENPETRDF